MPPLNPKKQKTSAEKIATQLRRNFVMQLRIAGLPFSAIVKKVYDYAIKEGFRLPKNYDELQACQDVLRELEKLERLNEPLRKRLLYLELERLDQLQAAIYPDAIKGNEKKITAVLKIMDRRAKYMGLDAPEKNEVHGDITVYLEQLQDRINEITGDKDVENDK